MRTILIQILLKMTHAPEKTFFQKHQLKLAERGIRTPVPIGTFDFESNTIVHSVISPRIKKSLII